MQPNVPLLDLPPYLRERCAAALVRHGHALESGCVVWTRMLNDRGYGRFTLSQRGGVVRTVGAHRMAWILAYGPIEDPALVLDHLCRNRACVNPEHLELVSNLENIHRGESLGNAGKLRRPASTERTAFVHGHPYPENAAYRKGKPKNEARPYLYCTQCARDENARPRAAARVGA